MNPKQQAAEQVFIVARQFQAVLDLAKQVNAIGDLEQAGAEAQQRVDALKQAEADAQVALADVQAQTSAAKRDADLYVSTANSQADNIVAHARDEAKKAGEAAAGEWQMAIKVADADLLRLAQQRDKLASEIDSLKVERDALQGTLESVKAEVEALKARFA